MLVFSKLYGNGRQQVSSLLDLRELMLLYPRFDLDAQEKLRHKLLHAAQSDKEILMIGDLLIQIYPDLDTHQKSNTYNRITALSNKFDFHLRRHCLTLLTLLIKEKQLTQEQYTEACHNVIQFCKDRNTDIRFQALNFMLGFFPHLSPLHKDRFFSIVEQGCKDPLDTDIKAFSKRFLIQNFEHLDMPQREAPICAEFNTIHPVIESCHPDGTLDLEKRHKSKL